MYFGLIQMKNNLQNGAGRLKLYTFTCESTSLTVRPIYLSTYIIEILFFCETREDSNKIFSFQWRKCFRCLSLFHLFTPVSEASDWYVCQSSHFSWKKFLPVLRLKARQNIFIKELELNRKTIFFPKSFKIWTLNIKIIEFVLNSTHFPLPRTIFSVFRNWNDFIQNSLRTGDAFDGLIHFLFSIFVFSFFRRFCVG